MELIKITKENLEKEHICCAISNNNDLQVQSKKAWISERLSEGLVFLKGNVRGKCFIEYIPAEYAWAPIEAADYMFIDCFWVSGRYKGQGNSSLLLEECIRDSREKGKLGLCVISSKKKLPFLSDPKYLRYKGFLCADSAEPDFELWYLPLIKDAPVPKFRNRVRKPSVTAEGFVLYYTHQCPFNAKYVPLLEEKARELDIPFQRILIDSREAAQDAPAAVTAFALFYNGVFITNEILSAAKLEKVAAGLVQRELMI